MKGEQAGQVFAAETSLVFLNQPTIQVSEAFVNGVVKFCCNFIGGELNGKNILTDCPRFADRLRILEEQLIKKYNLIKELRQIFGKPIPRPFSVVLNKPPETVALICLSNSKFVFADSQSRPNIERPYLIIHEAIAGLLNRLKEIWPETSDAKKEQSSDVSCLTVVAQPTVRTSGQKLDKKKFTNDEPMCAGGRDAECSGQNTFNSSWNELSAQEIINWQNKIEQLLIMQNLEIRKLNEKITHFMKSVQGSEQPFEHSVTSSSLTSDLPVFVS